MARNIVEAIDGIAEQWIDDVRVPRRSAVPKQVYHYTDAAGLIGMLSNHKIWLTDYRFLNDKSEFIYSKTLAEALFAELSAAGADRTAAMIIESFADWQKVDQPEDAFVFSLSEHDDDLSQWRGYAREGMGFTIGFDARRLHDIAAPSDGPFSFAKVSYARGEQLEAIRSAFAEIAEVVRQEGAGAGEKAAAREAARTFDWVVSSRGALNKHGSFAAEAEWRLIRYLSKGHPDIKVRASGLRLIPYIELAVDQANTHLPVRSIGIGPGFEQAEVTAAVRALVQQHGYADVRIYPADTPYRRL